LLELSLAFTIEGTEKHRGKKAQREGLEIPRCARTQSKNINHKGHEGTQRVCLVGPAFSTEGTEEHRGKKAQRERVGDSSLCSDAKAKTLTTKATKEHKGFVGTFTCFYHRGHRGTLRKQPRAKVGDSSLCSDAKAKTLTTKGTKELKAFVWSPCFYHRGHRGNTEGKRPERRLE
jgi:hypothetical protein